MLGEGHRRAERGTDVVVGFVETHGRQHTAEHDRRPRGRAPARASPTAAPRSPRWTSTRCWPAGPQVALVDELAHTNVPGLPQREALAGRRGAARGRASTSSPPSTSSTWSRSTTWSRRSPASRSARRSRTPWSARADQVELVDMAPEALRRRMAHGNVYAAREGRRRPGQLLPGRATSPPCASWRCCGWRTRSTRRCSSYRDAARHRRAPGRPASASSSRSPAAPRARR